MKWYCIYVKSRHEFKVLERLQNKQIEVFLPTVDRLRKWKDRRKIVTFPLFPGYLFIRIPSDKKSIVDVLKVDGVVKFLKSESGEPQVVLDSEIENLKRVVGSKKELEVLPSIRIGKKVKIADGPLKGVIGVLERREGLDYLIISVEILKRSVMVKIGVENVEPL